MVHHFAKRRVFIGLVGVTAVAITAVVHLDLRAQAGTASESPAAAPADPVAAAQGDEQDLRALRQQIEQSSREIRQAKSAMLQVMFERVKSIKRRRGLTPRQAQAFDDAYAEDMARIARAEEQLDAAREQLAAREETTPPVAVEQDAAATAKRLIAQERASRQRIRPPATGPDILARLDALERRVAVLERKIAR